MDIYDEVNAALAIKKENLATKKMLEYDTINDTIHATN